MIFLIGTCGVGASFALTKLIGKSPQPQPEFITRFFAINESEIVFGKPAYYRILVENHEGSNVDYELKVRLSGHEIYNQEIKLNNSVSLNRIISLNPNITGGYQKLEFLLYKDNEIYKTRVFQVSPAVDYSLAPNLTVAPSTLQNGDMEKDVGWKFLGKEFTGNYTTYDWSSPKRSYQIYAQRAVKKDAFGSLIQILSSEKAGFASLSFDVKSNNESYYTQALVNDEVVWENSSGKDWQRISIPLFLRESNKVEFKVIAKNDTNSGILVWWDNIKFEDYSPIKIENITKPYIEQRKGNTIVYEFNTGDKLELKVTNDSVNNGNAVYTTYNKGDNIIFLGETYEKVHPKTTSFLYPVLMSSNDNMIKINDTLRLKNGYAITLKQVNNQSLKLSIYLNNRLVKEINGRKNSTMEYWNEIDDYKKQKVIKITPREIYHDAILFDIIQYGDIRLVLVEHDYGEFQVTNMTNYSITLKNNQPIKLEAGKMVSLIGGKLKIKV